MTITQKSHQVAEELHSCKPPGCSLVSQPCISIYFSLFFPFSGLLAWNIKGLSSLKGLMLVVYIDCSIKKCMLKNAYFVMLVNYSELVITGNIFWFNIEAKCVYWIRLSARKSTNCKMLFFKFWGTNCIDILIYTVCAKFIENCVLGFE